MNGTFKKLLFAVSVTVFQIASAQSYPPSIIAADGQLYTATFTSAQKGISKAQIFFYSPGNMTSAFQVYIEGPAKLKAQLATRSGEGAIAQLAGTTGGWNEITFLGKRKGTKFLQIKGTEGTEADTTQTPSSGPHEEKIRKCMADPETKKLIDLYRKAGITLPADNVAAARALCANIYPDETGTSGSGLESGSGSLGSSSAFTAEGYVHFHKDACSAKSSKYTGRLELDFSEVNPAEFDAGFTVKVGLREHAFKGGKAASIKPASDGKYKNEPIFLGETVGYGGEYLNMVKWAGGKLKSVRRIPIVKYVSYRGLGLSLARLKGVLNGGKYTFELTDGGYIYGVCFAADRRRQSVNGYPIGG